MDELGDRASRFPRSSGMCADARASPHTLIVFYANLKSLYIYMNVCFNKLSHIVYAETLPIDDQYIII